MGGEKETRRSLNFSSDRTSNNFSTPTYNACIPLPLPPSLQNPEKNRTAQIASRLTAVVQLVFAREVELAFA